MTRSPRRDGAGPRADPAASHLKPLITFSSCVLVVACLYWGQAILIPIALAILITFLLGPVVSALRRTGLPQTPAVLLVVILALFGTAGIGWTLAHQATTLAQELPQYRANIARKIADIRAAQRGSLASVRESATDAMKELKRPEGPAARQVQPVPVVVEPPGAVDWLPGIPRVLTSVGLVTLLVVFMLMRRQELRARLIRVCGHGRLTVTTKALDEAGSRISRYLLMQTVMNSCFGLAMGLGLFLIGLPYALLWGFLAALLRFIPYLGTWIAATVPIVIAVAVFDGWTKLGLVLGLVVGVEFVIGYVIEPLLYGKSAGVSEVALLVGAAFWTALWGPMGLLLATPLTVCLVVLARNIPALEFIVVLMGDDADPAPDITYYQRLLATDQAEAAELVTARAKTDALPRVYEEILVPALTYANRDRRAGRLTEGEAKFVVSATRDIMADLEHSQGTPTAPPAVPAGSDGTPGSISRVRILGVPAVDEADVLGLRMLQRLLDTTRCELEIAPPMLSSEVVARVGREERPMLVCIAALPPGGAAQARHLSKRLRAGFPDIKILVGRWGSNGSANDLHELQAGGADRVGVSLHETALQVSELLPILATRDRDWLGPRSAPPRVVIHIILRPMSSCSLEAFGASLNVRIGRQPLDGAPPDSSLSIGGPHVRHAPYASVQVLRQAAPRNGSDSQLAADPPRSLA